jgi:5'-3' exoribonuclease 2
MVKLWELRSYIGRELGYRVNTREASQSSRERLERLVDDWIFICFFVGNDFLPHLPSLRIREGAIERLISIYKNMPKETKGDSYLHQDGKVNLPRLEHLLMELGKVEDKIFVDRRADNISKSAKKKRKKLDEFDNLTAQQQYERKHGKEADEVGLWMTALAQADREEGDKDGKGDAGTTPLTGAGSAQPVAKMPSWALSPLEGLDPATLESVANGSFGAGNISYRRDLSTEAEEWLERKRARAAKKGPGAWQAGAGATITTEEVALVPLTAASYGSTVEAPFSVDGDLATNGMDTEADGAIMGAGAISGAAAGGEGASASKDEVGAASGAVGGESADKDRLWEPGWKERYYMNKFHKAATDTEFKAELVHQYIKGLCWVLEYYYQGVPSWTWYFPYHYAPFASCCTHISDLQITFEIGKPFRPLEQLLGVFPSASASLLPPALGALMTEPSSPIIEFYPLEFETDLNGFKFAWQGVTILPFVEESALLRAAKQACSSGIDAASKRRNRLGNGRLYVASTHPLAKALLALNSDSSPLPKGGGAAKSRGSTQSNTGWSEVKQTHGGGDGGGGGSATSVVAKVRARGWRKALLRPGKVLQPPTDAVGVLAEVVCAAVSVELLEERVGLSYRELPGSTWPTASGKVDDQRADADLKKPCFAFAGGKGSCKFGSRCRFAHNQDGASVSLGTSAGASTPPHSKLPMAPIVAPESAAAAAAPVQSKPKKRWKSSGSLPAFKK